MDARPYHHGRLRQVVIDAAVAEVEAVGAAAVSMREIARRAGVSHAAPAHHFGDKAGIFTAVATEGFRLIGAHIAPAARGTDGFIPGGTAYVGFALEHPGHFEVMFRPDLCHPDDPGLAAARAAAFDLLYDSARRSPGVDDADAASALAVVGWSLAHGLATLWLSANLQDRLTSDLGQLSATITRGLVSLGELARVRLGET